VQNSSISSSIRHTSLGLAGYESRGTPVHYTLTACHPAPTRRRMGPFSYKWFCSRIRDRTGTSKAASRTTVSEQSRHCVCRIRRLRLTISEWLSFRKLISFHKCMVALCSTRPRRMGHHGHGKLVLIRPPCQFSRIKCSACLPVYACQWCGILQNTWILNSILKTCLILCNTFSTKYFGI